MIGQNLIGSKLNDELRKKRNEKTVQLFEKFNDTLQFPRKQIVNIANDTGVYLDESADINHVNSPFAHHQNESYDNRRK